MGRGRKRVISGKRIFRETKEDEKITSSGSKSTTTSHGESSVDNLQGDVELPAGVKDHFNETIGNVTENHAQEVGEYQATASKFVEGLQDVEERLKEEIQAITTEFQVASKAWDLEKYDLLSQIVAARNVSDEMSIQNEMVLLQYREEKVGLECGLNDSKASCQQLLLKIVEDRHQWDSEMANLQNNVALLQTKLESMATERELLNQQNSDLRTEVESLKAQLNESNAAVAQLEDQRSSIAAAKIFLEEANNSLQTEMDRIALVSKEEELNLQRKIGELETILVSVQKDLDSSMATTIEKDRNIDDLQYKLSEITEAKRLLEEKNDSILNDVNKRKMVLEEEKERLQLKIRDLQTNLHCANMNLESKNVQLHDLKTRRPLCPPKSASPQNGKGNGLRKNPKPIAVMENGSPNTTKLSTAKAQVENRTTQNRMPVKRSPKEPAPQKTSPKAPVPQKASPKAPEPQKDIFQ